MLAALSACSGAPPGETSETRGDIAGEPLTAAIDARYLTHLLFAADDGTAFVASFDQTAEGEDLRLDYDVRLAEGDSWRPLVRAQDTLSVARAAWRLLPARGMAVRVGDAGQVVSLLFSEPAGQAADTVRLVAATGVSVWTGRGTRESLGSRRSRPGSRRAGIPLLSPRRPGAEHSVAVTDDRRLCFADSLGTASWSRWAHRSAAVAHTGCTVSGGLGAGDARTPNRVTPLRPDLGFFGSRYDGARELRPLRSEDPADRASISPWRPRSTRRGRTPFQRVFRHAALS